MMELYDNRNKDEFNILIKESLDQIIYYIKNKNFNEKKIKVLT